MEISGIIFDLNRITRRDYTAFTMEFSQVETLVERDEKTGELAEKIIVSWPFDQPVSKEGYLNLGLADSTVIDRAIKEAMAYLSERPGEKK